MSKELQNINANNNILNSQEYNSLPAETKLKIAEFMVQKQVELSSEQQKYILEHKSSDKDIANYLAFLDKQREIQERNKGITVSYNSHETNTPTGKISSRTTNSTANVGCLLPIISLVILFILLL